MQGKDCKQFLTVRLLEMLLAQVHYLFGLSKVSPQKLQSKPNLKSLKAYLRKQGSFFDTLDSLCRNRMLAKEITRALSGGGSRRRRRPSVPNLSPHTTAQPAVSSSPTRAPRNTSGQATPMPSSPKRHKRAKFMDGDRSRLRLCGSGHEKLLAAKRKSCVMCCATLHIEDTESGERTISYGELIVPVPASVASTTETVAFQRKVRTKCAMCKIHLCTKVRPGATQSCFDVWHTQTELDSTPLVVAQLMARQRSWYGTSE